MSAAIETPMGRNGHLTLPNNPELSATFTNNQAMKPLGCPNKMADVALLRPVDTP